MAIHKLLNSQRNEIFIMIKDAGFDPATYKWENVVSLNDFELIVPRLVHIPSDSTFQFDLLKSAHWCQYNPGKETYIEQKYPGDWQGLLQYVRQWLQNLKEEVNNPDLWTTISGETTLLFGTPVTDAATNRPFSVAERERISLSLGEIKTYLVATQSLSNERLAFVEERLHYLEEAAGRMGRKDWVNLAYGALINIVVGAALAPAAATELLRIAGCALAWVLGGLPILPLPAQ